MAVHAPQFDADKASRRFLSNLVWVVILCGLFLAGQGVRSHYQRAQLDEIHAQTRKLYVSVLGKDIGQSPYGRLQFEHGKLAATLRIGLDPLSVLAALSRPAGENLRVESLVLDGMHGRVQGFFGPNTAPFQEYLDHLASDDHYLFTLEKREDVFGGILFTLAVEPK